MRYQGHLKPTVLKQGQSVLSPFAWLSLQAVLISHDLLALVYRSVQETVLAPAVKLNPPRVKAEPTTVNARPPTVK